MKCPRKEKRHMSMTALIVMSRRDFQKNSGVLLVIIKNGLDSALQ